MGYEIVTARDNRFIAKIKDGKVVYTELSHQNIKEIIAGQINTSSGSTRTSLQIRVVYKFDSNRERNNDEVYRLWKRNPIIQNRVRQLNAIVFGRGLQYSYDDDIQTIINKFWRYNRIRQKLTGIGTDGQLYGEVFIGLFPQANRTTQMAVYDPNSVEIDFNPANVEDINQYIVQYKDETKGQETQVMNFTPLYKYLNQLEFNNGVPSVESMVLAQNCMVHVKFNNASDEPYGTSDFRQAFGPVNEYMDFRQDRNTIHQLYGSPAYDIEIDTEDTNVIEKRIQELADFEIGSNPIHNTKEKWKPLEFSSAGSVQPDGDEKAMRGLICAGTGFPEHLLFNQGTGSEDSTFALDSIAEDRQDKFKDAFIDIHKFVVSVSGGDMNKVDNGQIVFPLISTMSEKTKAETYVLLVGANIVSRETATLNTGHNWKIEKQQMEDEQPTFGAPVDNSTIAGIEGGRFSTRADNQNPNRDTGEDDRLARATAQNISTQTFGNRKTNN